MKKELVLNVDDLGLHIDTVLAVQELWENKRISTVSLLSTSSILDATIDKLKKIGIPVGVHLILDGDRPILEKDKIPSLIDEQGFMLNDYNAIRKRVKPDEVFNEFSAQIENIQKRGVTVSHLDSHRGFCYLIPKLRKVYRELGRKYNLPLALPENFIFNKTRKLVHGSTDSLIGIYDLEEETFENRFKAYDLMLSKLGKGKHYCFSHPSPPTKSITEYFPDFKIRNNDYAIFLSDEWDNLLKKYNISISSF